jgi:hypothetical protein
VIHHVALVLVLSLSLSLRLSASLCVSLSLLLDDLTLAYEKQYSQLLDQVLDREHSRSPLDRVSPTMVSLPRDMHYRLPSQYHLSLPSSSSRSRLGRPQVAFSPPRPHQSAAAAHYRAGSSRSSFSPSSRQPRKRRQPRPRSSIYNSLPLNFKLSKVSPHHEAFDVATDLHNITRRLAGACVFFYCVCMFVFFLSRVA